MFHRRSWRIQLDVEWRKQYLSVHFRALHCISLSFFFSLSRSLPTISVYIHRYMRGRLNSICKRCCVGLRYRYSKFAISLYSLWGLYIWYGNTQVIDVLNWNCLYSWWPVHIMDSCPMQAMCVADITTSFQFSYASTTGTLQYKREAMCGQDGFVSEHLCTRRVSLWDWQECGWKEQFQALHANMNELIAFQDIARHCFWSFGSSPYLFPWFGATFKTKERLTRRLLRQHFSQFLTYTRAKTHVRYIMRIIKKQTNFASHGYKGLDKKKHWSGTTHLQPSQTVQYYVGPAKGFQLSEHGISFKMLHWHLQSTHTWTNSCYPYVWTCLSFKSLKSKATATHATASVPASLWLSVRTIELHTPASSLWPWFEAMPLPAANQGIEF